MAYVHTDEHPPMPALAQKAEELISFSLWPKTAHLEHCKSIVTNDVQNFFAPVQGIWLYQSKRSFYHSDISHVVYEDNYVILPWQRRTTPFMVADCITTLTLGAQRVERPGTGLLGVFRVLT